MEIDRDTQIKSIKTQQSILGGIVWLAQNSVLYQNYPIGHLLRRVMPSLELNQFRYYSDADDIPMGFVNWAFLDEDSLKLACTGELDFEDKHWRSGDKMFITEIIAPFGHCRKIARDMRQNVIPPDLRFWAVKGQLDTQEAPENPKVYRFQNSQF